MFTIPDKGEGFNDHQSILFQTHLNALAQGIAKKNYVISGCEITPSATAGALNMSAGVVINNSVRYTAGTFSQVYAALTPDLTYPKFVLIYAYLSGGIVVPQAESGVASAVPKLPDIPAGYAALAAVYVPPGGSVFVFTAAHITDMRVFNTQEQPLNTTLTAIADNSLGAFGHRNKIINGDMRIAQRGTDFIPAPNQQFLVDRFKLTNNTSAVVNGGQGVGPSPFLNTCYVTVTTADTSMAITETSTIEQLIDGYNVRDLVGRDFTLSFRVASAKTGIHCISFASNNGDRSFVVEYTVNSANTWETKTVTVPGGLITAGTWNYTNGIGLYVRFALAAGSDFQTTKDAWQTGNYIATANQVNCLDTVGNTFAITGVQLEVGSVATPFEHRPYGTELALCQRYYYRVGGGLTEVLLPSGAASSDTAGGFLGAHPVPMCAIPTLTYGGSLALGLTGGTVVSLSINANTSAHILQVAAVLSGATVGPAIIRAGDTTGFIAASAEL
jgi:hypothetical protein